MKLSDRIDLGRSLRQVFGENPDSETQVRIDRDRQTQTAESILARFFAKEETQRRELVLLADEVGLGKTYVALAVAVTILDTIRQGQEVEGFPANKPVVLVLTPNNEALYNKWLREAEAFRRDCAREDGCFDWLQIERPLENSAKSGNIADLTRLVRQATSSRPMLLIAKQSALGASLHDRDWWRCRALACVFEVCGVRCDERLWWCQQLLDTSEPTSVSELLDLRESNFLWTDTADYSPDLKQAYQRVLEGPFRAQLATSLAERNCSQFADLVDNLTREALIADWPQLPLLIIDEVHGLKTRTTKTRGTMERFLNGRASRILGLSATPFQLRHDELLSVLELRSLAALSKERSASLTENVARLAEVMQAAREGGERFRQRWRALRPRDRSAVHTAWDTSSKQPEPQRTQQFESVRPPRIMHALKATFALAADNKRLETHLRPFVIRHRHPRGYREHFVGHSAAAGNGPGTPSFTWAPGMEVQGNAELAHYLMMRAVALAKEEKGLPGLGAELTGSYRHLIETSAIWKRFAQTGNPLLPKYRSLLESMLPVQTADHEHQKVQTTVRRAVDFFARGQKTVIFCVYTKTAEAIRDELDVAIRDHLQAVRDRVFEGETSFANFRRRFFNRREPLYSLIQDHPLLSRLRGREVGIPVRLRLRTRELREVGRLLLEHGESPDVEKPDRRLILAAVEHVAVRNWRKREEGQQWLQRALGNCQELEARMAKVGWVRGREPLSRRAKAAQDPEARGSTESGMQEEEEAIRKVGTRPEQATIDKWVARLSKETVGDAIATYFSDEVIGTTETRLPLLAAHHSHLLAQLDITTRGVGGDVFRRILMAEEFLLRYLADVPRDETQRWADYLADRYTRPLAGHLESLRDRVTAYLETLVRARQNKSLMAGYHTAAENRNVVQLVQGGTTNRDRYFLGFNTPYRPEILISTSVGQEGIDLHRECRHVIHHDLCWNPATIEQRTGRVDRIGSKVERERAGVAGEPEPTLEIAVPYLAATYDERMFEELYRRAQLFEVTMGGEVRVEGRFERTNEEEHIRSVREGSEGADEDLGDDGETAGVDLPTSMVEQLRVDLSVWHG